MKRIIVGGGCVLMLMLLSGCGKSKAVRNPEELIIQSMKEKYDLSVDISNIEEESGIQAFQESTYHARVIPEGSREEFHVYLGKKSKTLKDDYPRLIYDDMIRAYAEEEINHFQNLDISSYNILYRPSEGKWTTEDGKDVFDYLTESDTEIRFVIRMGSVAEKSAEDIYTFAETLEKKGIQFTLRIEKEEDTVFISSWRNSKLKEKEIIIKMLTGK